MTTWDELSLAQQMILEAARKHNVIVATDRDGVLAPYEWPHAAFEKFITDGYLEQFGIGTSYYTRYRLTPAGRALLPAPTLTPQALDAAVYGTPEYWEAMSNASVEAHAETLERVQALEAENARLKAALEWYADAANYVENWTSTSVYCPDSSDAQRDEGERARKALKPE